MKIGSLRAALSGIVIGEAKRTEARLDHGSAHCQEPRKPIPSSRLREMLDAPAICAHGNHSIGVGVFLDPRRGLRDMWFFAEERVDDNHASMTVGQNAHLK